MRHTLDTAAVMAALEEVVLDREFTLASGESATGGRKLLTYSPGRKVFTIKETTAKDLECGSAEMAANYYSDR